MIKAVLFDFGGVLSPGGKSLRALYAKLLDIPEEDVRFDKDSDDFRRGNITPDKFFNRLSQKYGKNVTTEEFNNLSDLFVKNQAVYVLAASLRKNGIQTGILSNVYINSADILQKGGYYDEFEPKILSYNEGLAKPDPEFYKLAVNRLGLSADQVLFIDDQEKCLVPARELGMHVIKADNEEQIVADVRALFRKENGLAL